MEARPVDLARLVAIIAEEVMAATRRPVTRCGCHSVIDDCCPTRLQGVIDAGAARLGVHAAGGAPSGVPQRFCSSSAAFAARPCV